MLSAYCMPPNAESINTLRIVLRPHLNRTVVDQLAHDVIAACDYLKENGGNAKPPELHKHAAPKCCAIERSPGTVSGDLHSVEAMEQHANA